jgi:hypothetical protein
MEEKDNGITRIKASDARCLEILDDDGERLALLEFQGDGYFSIDVHRQCNALEFALGTVLGQDMRIIDRVGLVRDKEPRGDVKGSFFNLHSAEGSDWRSKKPEDGDDNG